MGVEAVLRTGQLALLAAPGPIEYRPLEHGELEGLLGGELRPGGFDSPVGVSVEAADREEAPGGHQCPGGGSCCGSALEGSASVRRY